MSKVTKNDVGTLNSLKLCSRVKCTRIYKTRKSSLEIRLYKSTHPHKNERHAQIRINVRQLWSRNILFIHFVKIMIEIGKHFSIRWE